MTSLLGPEFSWGGLASEGQGIVFFKTNLNMEKSLRML